MDKQISKFQNDLQKILLDDIIRNLIRLQALTLNNRGLSIINDLINQVKNL